MMRHTSVTVGLVSVAFGLGVYFGLGVRTEAQRTAGVLEIRRYTANDGKLDALVKRMGGGEAKLFEKHGMRNVFHAVAAEAPESQNTYIYVLGHDSREAAKKSWDAFRADPDWISLRASSEVNGALVGKAEATFVKPTDYSAVR